MKKIHRLSMQLTDEALKIYDALPKHEKSKWVSEAIIEKHNRSKGEVFTPEQEKALNEFMEFNLNKLCKELEERIKRLERMIEK